MSNESTSPGEVEIDPAAIQSIAVNTVARILKEGAGIAAVLTHVARAVNVVPEPERENLLGQIIGQLALTITLMLATHPTGAALLEQLRQQLLFNDVTARYDDPKTNNHTNGETHD